MWCWEQNPGAVQEHQAPLPAEPAVQPLSPFLPSLGWYFRVVSYGLSNLLTYLRIVSFKSRNIFVMSLKSLSLVCDVWLLSQVVSTACCFTLHSTIFIIIYLF